MPTTGPQRTTTNREAVRGLVGELARARRPAPRAAVEPQRRLSYVSKFTVAEITTTIRTIPVEVSAPVALLPRWRVGAVAAS